MNGWPLDADQLIDITSASMRCDEWQCSSSNATCVCVMESLPINEQLRHRQQNNTM
jgi:hypothetical protein